jgi:2-polyprenyl-3-methyl-5-hydroxy-6-metoxy-1,4-benzoquinol methylase
MSSETRRWTTLGSRDPYWAVCVDDRYRTNRLTEEDRRDFFASGEQEVAQTLDAIGHVRSGPFSPQRTLDFGCGVGRLTLPLARLSAHVVGVDISEPMLVEARRNAETQGLPNAEFLQTDAFLAQPDTPSFDFIHSYIVFQHIPPATGIRITQSLLQRLRPGGIGALHYTYARRASALRRIVNTVRRRVRPVDIAIRVMQGKAAMEPGIPMHAYDLATLFALLASFGCTRIGGTLTDHGGYLGVQLLFEKAQRTGA